MSWRCGTSALVILLSLAPLRADEAGSRIYRLEPKTRAGLEHGKAVIVRGESTPQGHRYFLEGLNMLTPVSVTLVAKRPGDDVQLAITKLSWAKAERVGSTGKEGIISFRFRTQGEFQMTVSAQGEPKPYQLVAWVGDEVKPEFTPVVVKQSEYKAGKGEGGMRGGPLWVIAGLLAIIAALLALLALRRKRA